MINLQKIRDRSANALSQGVKLHLYLRQSVDLCINTNGRLSGAKRVWFCSTGFSCSWPPLMAGCSRRSQCAQTEVLQQGDLYLQKGISRGQHSYSVPCRSTHACRAHYKRAQCLLKLSSWRRLQEPVAPVDLHQKTACQLDLGHSCSPVVNLRKPKDRPFSSSKQPKTRGRTITFVRRDALGNLESALEEARKATEMAPDRSASLINLVGSSEGQRPLTTQRQAQESTIPRSSIVTPL